MRRVSAFTSYTYLLSYSQNWDQVAAYDFAHHFRLVVVAIPNESHLSITIHIRVSSQDLHGYDKVPANAGTSDELMYIDQPIFKHREQGLLYTKKINSKVEYEV